MLKFLLGYISKSWMRSMFQDQTVVWFNHQICCYKTKDCVLVSFFPNAGKIQNIISCTLIYVLSRLFSKNVYVYVFVSGNFERT